MQVVGQVNRIAVKRAEPGNGWPLTLAPASLGIGLRAVAVYPPSAIGIGQPQGFLVEAQPTHITAAVIPTNDRGHPADRRLSSRRSPD